MFQPSSGGVLHSNAALNQLCCMQLWQESQVKTDIAAVAQRERNVLEMHVEDQQDLYDREMTKLTTEKEEVSHKAFHWCMRSTERWHALAAASPASEHVVSQMLTVVWGAPLLICISVARAHAKLGETANAGPLMRRARLTGPGCRGCRSGARQCSGADQQAAAGAAAGDRGQPRLPHRGHDLRDGSPRGGGAQGC